jgi:hypothetical protein
MSKFFDRMWKFIVKSLNYNSNFLINFFISSIKFNKFFLTYFHQISNQLNFNSISNLSISLKSFHLTLIFFEPHTKYFALTLPSPLSHSRNLYTIPLAQISHLVFVVESKKEEKEIFIPELADKFLVIFIRFIEWTWIKVRNKIERIKRKS